MVVRPGIIALRYDEKSFFGTILDFTPHWDYKLYNEYVRQKTVNLGTIFEIHIKSDCIDSSVVNGLQQSILFSFVLDKPPGY